MSEQERRALSLLWFAFLLPFLLIYVCHYLRLSSETSKAAEAAADCRDVHSSDLLARARPPCTRHTRSLSVAFCPLLGTRARSHSDTCIPAERPHHHHRCSHARAGPARPSPLGRGRGRERGPSRGLAVAVAVAGRPAASFFLSLSSSAAPASSFVDSRLRRRLRGGRRLNRYRFCRGQARQGARAPERVEARQKRGETRAHTLQASQLM